MQASLSIAGLVYLAFIINIPCGYLRENFKKFSPMWWILIHLPIPVIVALRIFAGISWHAIPLTLGGSVGGQVVGAMINRRRKQSG